MWICKMAFLKNSLQQNTVIMWSTPFTLLKVAHNILHYGDRLEGLKATNQE